MVEVRLLWVRGFLGRLCCVKQHDGHRRPSDDSPKGLPNMTPRLKTLVTALAATAAFALPAAAQAGPLVASAPDCAAQTLSQPFLPFADPMQYTLLPGGTFENGNRWSGGSVVAGNEPWNVTGPNDHKSLSLGDGSSTTSGSICVGLDHPDVRFFAAASDPRATLKVEVLFEDAFGHVLSAPIGSVAGSAGWSPTLPMPIGVNLLPLLPGNYTAVAFRFTANGGDWTIDDVYVDPICRR
jgi:hypothetical protein